jgi:hypothetical protein
MSTAANFWAPITKKVEQRHNDQLDLQRQQRESYQSLIQNPNSSDAIKNWAWGEYQKSLHPTVQKRIAGVQPLIQKMLGGQQQQSAGAPAQQPATQPQQPAMPAAPQQQPADTSQNADPASSAGSMVARFF